MSFTATRRTDGSGLASANRATVVRINRRRPLFVTMAVRSDSGDDPAPLSETASNSSNAARLPSVDFAMTTFWPAV